MSELGQQLKEARLQKGLSLDDVQEMTKIRKRYLEAIETGDYKVLPGSFYVRAFIKTYAETVGLDPDEVLEGHKSSVPDPQPEAVMEPVTQSRASRPPTERNLKWLPTTLMWLFPVIIILLIYVYVSGNKEKTPNKVDNQAITDQNQPSTTTKTDPPQQQTTTPKGGGQSATTPDTGSATTTPDPNQSTGNTNTDGAAGTTTNEQQQDSTPQQGITVTEDGKQGKNTIFKVASSSSTPPKVEIKATGESWLEVYKGQNSHGEKLTYGMTKSGDTFSFDIGQEGVYIKSGRASATDITVGGQTVSDKKSTSRILLQLGEASTTSGSNTSTDTNSTDTNSTNSTNSNSSTESDNSGTTTRTN